MEKLKKRWGLKTNWDLFAVFCVFSINGSLAAKLGTPVLNFFNITPENTSLFVRIICRIFFILPIYQFTLPFVGWCFGKFNFFWEFDKKMLKKMGFGFLFKK